MSIVKDLCVFFGNQLLGEPFSPSDLQLKVLDKWKMDLSFMFVFVLNVLKILKSDGLTSWVILRVKSTRRVFFFFFDELQI